MNDVLELMLNSDLSKVDTTDLINDKKERLERMFDGYLDSTENPTIKGFCDWVKEWMKKGMYLSVHEGCLYIDQTNDITNEELYEYCIYKIC